VIELCIDEAVIQRFTPIQANESTLLVVKISSFSYRKGIPPDTAGNGGGFMFDVRGIDNPGRHEEYKTIHGPRQARDGVPGAADPHAGFFKFCF
jgi:RNase adaptor protein for sRNA GlmZ degradation